ncbi:MAG: iron chaperone [Protaetiibacter sp.]
MAETKKNTSAFNAEERAAMKEHAAEVRRSKKSTPEEDAQAVLDKIAAMPEPDRGLAERIHAIVTEVAPTLAPKLWYGMPAYYRDGKNVVFFQDAAKFKARYATLGFNDPALLDDGTMWPTAYALTYDLTSADEKLIAQLVKKAAG